MNGYCEGAAGEAGGESCWYAVHVRCNQEWNVERGLSCRGISHFLPCYESVRQWKDRRIKLQMPLFPGYLFVRIPLRDRLVVVTVPNVVSLVGSGNNPLAVPQEQIDWIQRGIEHGNALPHEWLAVGQRVVIVQGAMAGLEGILVSKRNSNRMVIALESIAQAFAVEVDAEQLRAVPAKKAGAAPLLLRSESHPLRAEV
jgi:transcription antitermination factor NusG